MGKYKKFLYFFTLIISFIFIPKVFAAEPNMSNHSFQGLGVNTNLLDCSVQGTSCYWRGYDFDLMSIGAEKNYQVGASPIVPIGYNFNIYNGGVFIDGYVYTLEFTIYDNTSNIEYYRQWSYNFHTGYNSYGTTNEYANILATRITRAGGNITFSIDFTAKDWFRYLRVVARAPFSPNENKVYPSITDVDRDIVYNSLLHTGTLTIRMASYKLSYMPDYEYKNSQQNDEIISKQNETNDLLEDSNKKQQEMINKQNETNQKLDANKQAIDNQTNTLKDSDSSKATNEAGSFFSGFETDTFGLTSIITAPINLITSITSSTCAPVGLPIPFVDNMTLNLPCIRGIYEQHFGSILSVYQTITFGIVAYWVCIRIFALVKDFKNPEHDEIEVLDL